MPKTFLLSSSFLALRPILSNASGSKGPTYFLELFREFEPCAWAFACLGNLYRMLNKGVKWIGIKDTEGSEDVICAGLDPTNESGAFEYTFKTLQGLLELLQVLF